MVRHQTLSCTDGLPLLPPLCCTAQTTPVNYVADYMVDTCDTKGIGFPKILGGLIIIVRVFKTFQTPFLYSAAATV